MSGKRLFVFCVVAAAFQFSALAPSGYSQQTGSPGTLNQSTVSGYVFGPNRSRLSDVQIQLLNEFNRVVSRAKTDSSGRYYFRGLASGRWVVKVIPLSSDLEEQSQDFEISGFNMGGKALPENVQRDFFLRSRKGVVTSQIKGVVFLEDVPPEAKLLFKDALRDLDDKKADAGVEKLIRLVAAYPRYYAASERLGIEYVGRNKFAAALDIFTKAVEINSRGFASWYGMAYSALALERPHEALDAAEKALVQVPNSVEVLFIRGLAERRLKHYLEAEKTLVQAKKLDEGRTPDIHWNLALLYAHNLNRYAEASNELELYLRAKPDADNKDAVKKLIKKFRDKKPGTSVD